MRDYMRGYKRWIRCLPVFATYIKLRTVSNAICKSSCIVFIYVVRI